MKTEDKMIKAFLKEEMEKEAAEIKKKIEENPELCEGEPDPELKDKIWQKFIELQRQKEAYQNLSEEDKEALQLGKELQIRREEKENEELSEELMPETAELAAGAEDKLYERSVQTAGSTKQVPVRKRRKKAIIALAAALVAVLGFGITSLGDRGYVTETVKQLLGKRKMTNIDTDHAGKEEKINTDEENVYQKIKDEFGFDPVRMDYEPVDMEMVDYTLEKEFLSVMIYYQYGENVFTYTATPSYQDLSFGYDIEDPIVDEYVKTVKDTKIEVTEYRIEDTGQQEFSAKFQYNDVSYILTGIIKKEEFEKILENLHFF